MLGTYHLNTVYEILKNLHFLYQSEKIYAYLLENLVKAVDADAASLFLCNSKSKTLVLKACIGPKKKVFEIIAEELPFPFGKGICGWVAQYAQPVLCGDVQEEHRFNAQLDALTGYKTKSVLCVPIVSIDKVLGVVEILNKKSAVFNKNDMDMVALIASQAAIALENAHLYTELEMTRNFSESILSNLTGGLIAVGADETITHFNPVAEKILLLSSSELVGQKCNEALKAYPAICGEIIKTLKSREKIVRQEMCCRRPDGTSIKIGYSTFAMLDLVRNIIGAGIVFQNLPQ